MWTVGTKQCNKMYTACSPKNSIVKCILPAGMKQCNNICGLSADYSRAGACKRLRKRNTIPSRDAHIFTIKNTI